MVNIKVIHMHSYHFFLTLLTGHRGSDEPVCRAVHQPGRWPCATFKAVEVEGGHSGRAEGLPGTGRSWRCTGAPRSSTPPCLGTAIPDFDPVPTLLQQSVAWGRQVVQGEAVFGLPDGEIPGVVHPTCKHLYWWRHLVICLKLLKWWLQLQYLHYIVGSYYLLFYVLFYVLYLWMPQGRRPK